MKIVVAPDSFKGTLTAVEVAACIRRGLGRVLPEAEIVELPLADGGEGFVETMVAATGGAIEMVEVEDPLGRPIQAHFGMLPGRRTAVIEMASASGLPLLEPAERNPLRTSTYGTGQLVHAALDRGARHILLGIGGSATVDGGLGMASALGVKFFDEQGVEIGKTGGDLAELSSIDARSRDSRLRDTRVEVACDVDNPLTGERGAAAVFGPQKGATPDMVERLDSDLARLARVIQRDLGVEVDTVPGAGAAGGLGAGLLAFLGARLRSGVTLVLDHVGFEKVVAGADLVITGEGRLDGQTLHGKLPAGVARSAAALGCPTLALAGALADELGALHTQGIAAYFSAVDRLGDEATIYHRSAAALESLAEQVARTLRIGARLTGPI